jgi:hypothetical protein
MLWLIKRIKEYKLRKQLENFARVVSAIDQGFTRRGISRRERRNFWHGFVTSPEYRQKVIKGIKL